MGYNTIFYFILFFVIVEYLIQQSLSMLNRRAASPSLPLELVGLYDKEKYAEQQRYFAENNRFGSIVNTATILVILILLFTGLFGWLDEWTREITSDSLLWSTLLFFGILFCFAFCSLYAFYCFCRAVCGPYYIVVYVKELVGAVCI